MKEINEEELEQVAGGAVRTETRIAKKKYVNAAVAIGSLSIWDVLATLYVRDAAIIRSFWNGFMISHS